ncbi:MAG: ATP synthase F0 subunit B [Planctomycetes bacterium]|nr:ATP synthase F0 subunit B [Planctomycetota bacterium]
MSKHTLVLRKAKDDDARRLSESSRQQESGVTRIIRSPQPSRLKIPGAEQQREKPVSAKTPPDSARRVSGRTVIVHQGGDVSKRLTVSTRASGAQASVRVTGGDTIIRYQSGDMVVKRADRRAQVRRRVIWSYALGYLILFGLYGYFLLTGTRTITPDQFVESAFSLREGETVLDLERAAMETMRGNRTPAEVRLAQPLSFHDANNDTITIATGERLSLLTGAKLGQAILRDQRRPADRRALAEPIKLYKETYLANMNWPFWLTLYNAFGFFLLLFLFLWRPIRDYLGTEGKKTAVALRTARDAQETAAKLRDDYRSLSSELEERKIRLRRETLEAGEKEQNAALINARAQAGQMVGGWQQILEDEAERSAARLGADTAGQAIRLAKTLLEQRLGQAEHDMAIDELIADITAMPAGCARMKDFSPSDC